MDNQTDSVEETTEVTEPETNADDTSSFEETQESSEETENTQEVEPEKPKSRASERIRELIAENKRLKESVRQPVMEQEKPFEGVEETGIDPQKFATDVVARAKAEAASIGSFEAQKLEAMRRFPLVAEDEFVGAYAVDLVEQGYSPVQAAELATLQYKERQTKKNQSQEKAQVKSRVGTQIPSAGKSIKKTEWTREEIAKMSDTEYEKNRAEIMQDLHGGSIQ